MLDIQPRGNVLVLVVQHRQVTQRCHVQRISIHHLGCLVFSSLAALLRELGITGSGLPGQDLGDNTVHVLVRGAKARRLHHRSRAGTHVPVLAAHRGEGEAAAASRHAPPLAGTARAQQTKPCQRKDFRLGHGKQLDHGSPSAVSHLAPATSLALRLILMGSKVPRLSLECQKRLPPLCAISPVPPLPPLLEHHG